MNRAAHLTEEESDMLASLVHEAAKREWNKERFAVLASLRGKIRRHDTIHFRTED